MTRNHDVRDIQARWVLGLLASEELPTVATGLLSEGIESEALIELAGMPDHEGGTAALFEKALDELGFGAMEPTDALKRYARAVSRSILASEIAPLEGANRIWRATLRVAADGWHELDTFIYAASEAEDRLKDREFFEKAVLDEARKWSREEF